LGQKRSLINPVLALRQGLPHQFQLGGIELLEGQLQVANAAMEQLRAPGTGALAWITRLQ